MIELFGLDVFRYIVAVQPFAWLPLLYYKNDGLEKLHSLFLILALASMMGLYGLYIYGVTALQTYPTLLVLFYCAEVFIVYEYQSDWQLPSSNFTFRVALSFLIPYVCSGFWELPLHIIDLFQNGLSARVILQLTRFIPLLFIASFYRVIDAKKLRSRILISLWISSLILSLELFGIIPDTFTYLVRSINFFTMFMVFFDRKTLIRKTDTFTGGETTIGTN